MEALLILILQIGIVLLPIALGFVVGSWREKSHLRSLDEREQQDANIVLSNLKKVTQPDTIRSSTLVIGEVVIATDYFKTFAAGLKGIVGGELKTYNTLMTRARREATLRMIEQAKRCGANEIWNVRYQTSNIMSASSQGTKKVKATSVEVMAFGTAVVRN